MHEIMHKELAVFSKMQEGAFIPEYQTEGASGADLRAYLTNPVVLKPMERRLIPTGLALAVPEGYELQVRPRSGLALRMGITVLNAPGTVDSDYRGELQVLLVNFGTEQVTIHHGDRIAQAVVAPVVRVTFIPTDTLSVTERGINGYGSTGII
ncbi:MAG: dUTP diphosphatase [Treponema sp.]